MTNAEKIRSMTDEELAAWLKETLDAGFEKFEIVPMCFVGSFYSCLQTSGTHARYVTRKLQIRFRSKRLQRFQELRIVIGIHNNSSGWTMKLDTLAPTAK